MDLLLLHRVTVFDTKSLGPAYVIKESLNKTRFPQLLLACSLELRHPLAISWAASYGLREVCFRVQRVPCRFTARLQWMYKSKFSPSLQEGPHLTCGLQHRQREEQGKQLGASSLCLGASNLYLSGVTREPPFGNQLHPLEEAGRI